MLSYQHSYHAGSFADVIKHLALTQLLAYLTHKDKPLFYLETHSGRGVYLLKSRHSEKTGEYKKGIQLIWDAQSSLPPEFDDYIACIKGLNLNSVLRDYPGSPYFALQALRQQDRAYCCELHPLEFENLMQMPRSGKKVHISHCDGLMALNALLPPPEKRGLIFIDPSYEMKDEYKKIPTLLKDAITRFPTGVYCLWYPLVHNRLTEQLNRGMKALNVEKTLKIEFHLNSAEEGMTGCGLWIINPPYTFAEDIKVVLNTLKTYFNPGKSSYIVVINPHLRDLK